jgi:hypothetical protein
MIGAGRRINLPILLACLALSTAAPVAPATGAPAAAAGAPAPYCRATELDDGRPRTVCIRLGHFAGDVCAAVERFARDADLPAGYFARLIWRESHFDPNAVSPAGAEGIAQFMPGTARLQGLENPFDPVSALWHSAQYLRFLAGKFGNLGLAAAAYNGGEGAAGRFVAGTGYLAVETLDYVRAVTGAPVTRWLTGEAGGVDYVLQPGRPFHAACLELAETGRATHFTPPVGIVRPWGVQLAQFFSEATARRAFTRIQSRFHKVLAGEDLMLVAKRNPNFGPALRYTAEIGRDSREAAEKLCATLRRAGGACIVVRN